MKSASGFVLAVSVIASLAASGNAIAQIAVPAQSSHLPPAPVPDQAIPDVRIEPQKAAPDTGPAGPSVLVNSLHITGCTQFSESKLIAATGFTPGHLVNLSDLRRMAVKITEYYNSRGFIVAQAYVPAQEIADGVVTIAVVEGRYGRVTLQNHSRLHSGVAQDILDGLDSGDLVEADPLDRRLLLLSDLPGVGVKATLSPGTDVGTSDLLVDVTPGASISGEVDVDNYGNPYTGAYQGGGTVNFNEPLGIGDVATIRLLTSGAGMQYGRASYQLQWGDGTVGAAYAYFHYHLGDQFSVLDASGWEQIASVFGSYPIIRSYDDNLRALIDVDHRIFQDSIGATSTVTDKQTNVVTIGLAGDHSDSFGGGGWDAYSISTSFGDLDIETPLARAEDAATLGTNGAYGKLNFSADRLQTVTGPFDVYALVRGQVAFKNLDISEKMELGGAYAVRAYPEGEAYGDEGYIATVEGRVWLPKPVEWIPGRMQFIAFFDTGAVRFDEDPLPGVPNSATRSGAGIGLDWTSNNDFTARVSYAWIVGDQRATSAPGSGQLWFEVVKFF
jgi:hemolysin activation/secretion protein